jgi:predicted GNAT superfamily acetyltransferase
MPSVRGVDLGRSDPVLLVEVPPDIQAIKQADLGLARDWVGRFREIFPHYFACGYRVTGFVPLDSAGALRRAYVLSCQGHVARGPV